MPQRRRHFLLALSVLIACTSEPSANDAGDTDEPQPGTVTFSVLTDATVYCEDDGVEAVRIATKRVGCWDPEVPCTVPSDPPWTVGTSYACAELTGAAEDYEVSVSQTGKWDTQLQGVAGDEVVDAICLKWGAVHPVQVANADLDEAREFELSAMADDGSCEP